MKSTLIALRLKDHELDWLKKLSSADGYANMSEYLRMQLFYAAKKSGLVNADYKKCYTLSDMRTGSPRKTRS